MKKISAIKNQDAKQLLCNLVLKQIQNKSVELCLREIIFDDSTNIDWKHVYQAIEKHLPEISLE